MLSGSRWYRLIITIVLQVIPVTSAEGESVKTFVADPPPRVCVYATQPTSVCLRHPNRTTEICTAIISGVALPAHC